MPPARRELRTCPHCLLALTIVSDDRGSTCEYDVNEWARVCYHPNSGTPVACPATQPILEGLLKDDTSPD
jgi:hypothetical protein